MHGHTEAVTPRIELVLQERNREVEQERQQTEICDWQMDGQRGQMDTECRRLRT